MPASSNWPPGWPSSSGDWPSSAPPPADLAGLPDSALLAGIAAYRRHPYERDLPDPPALWREGSTRLLDYGPPNGRPVLVVPSLVNRAHVLDLLPEHSMLRWLAANGARPLLLDWGWPGDTERNFTLTDYIAGRLERAAESLGEAVAVAGYCMGGLMALALAARRPTLVARLALLATPWDFHAADPVASGKVAALLPLLEPALAFTGALPVDALQILFSLLEPGGVARKYRGFAEQDPQTPRARRFVALEDWLNDGVPLAAPVARECLGGWYGRNAPAEGTWRIAGAPVLPESVTCPALVAVPQRDRIVPPESARPLAARIPGATLLAPAAGHVGMVAGSSAETVLWRPLLDWLLAA